MATTWTQADVDELRGAIRSGILSVRYSGPPERFVQYQNITEMRSLLAEMQSQVAETSGTPRPRYRLVSTRKGV